MRTWQSYLEFLEESISGDPTTFNFDYTPFFNLSIRADTGKYFFFFKLGKIVSVATCLPTCAGIPSLGRRIREGGPNNLNAATHRARKRKLGWVEINGVYPCFVFLAQIVPCIMSCSFEGKYGSQIAVTRLFFHGLLDPGVHLFPIIHK